jgi:hypothetical protein
VTYYVKLNRAFGSSSVHWGPFATVEDAQAWCREREIAGMIIGAYPPETDTGPWSEVWSS